MTKSKTVYEGREQSLVKHQVLDGYLLPFAMIVGARWKTINYIDCFSGPWKSRDENREDTSFGRALRELRKAQSALRARGKNVKLRCLFLEKTRASFNELSRFAEEHRGADEVLTHLGALENSVPRILDFIRDGGKSAFSFVFIDPTGWSGFGMKTIQPLLETDSSEVLINLMTRHIRRFIELKEKAESFEDLFGSASVREEASKKQGLDREDFLVKSYMLNVKRAGSFKFVSSALVLQPTADATHFHLIYATRSVKGIEVFKNAERRAMNAMETVRTGKRLEKDPEPLLFEADELGASAKFRDMRARYNDKSRAGSLALIEKRGELPYDDLFGYALAVPLTFEADLKTWLKQWTKEGRITVIGRGTGPATSKIMEGVSVKWIRR